MMQLPYDPRTCHCVEGSPLIGDTVETVCNVQVEIAGKPGMYWIVRHVPTVPEPEQNMEFPSVDEVASILDDKKAFTLYCEDGWMDVRLQVRPNSSWNVLTGDSSYDQDHRGYWGCGSLSAETDTRGLADNLIDQAADDYASSK